MKIGILTIHRATNFGTALQAAATVSLFRDLGADAELIDYRPECFERTFRLRTLNEVRSVKTALTYAGELVFRRRTQKQKIAEFEEFMVKLPASEPIYRKQDLPEVCRRYDMVIVGSDQVWNTAITLGDYSYFLDFEHPSKAAFSSSFGVAGVSGEERERIASLLEDFRIVTVREKTAARCIEGMIADGSLIPHPREVLDPTLFYGIDWWRERAVPAGKPREGYILGYYMRPSPLLIHATERLSRETGLPVVNIKPSKMDVIRRNGINAAAAGPGRFIDILADATYVVTNSFHGTAFSLNFEKPFISVPIESRNGMDLNSRMTDLLELAGLSHRFATSAEEIDAMPLQVDFTEAEVRLADARARSWEIAKNIITE